MKKVQLGLQVVLLAGGSGKSLYPLCSGETPKCLLPLGNRPALSYSLELLERVGLTDVILVTSEWAYSKIGTYISELYRGSIKPNIQCMPGSLGTAEILQQLSSSIHTDFVVMSSDLILDDEGMHELLDYHRIHDPAVTVLLKEENSDNKKKAGCDLVGMVGGEGSDPLKIISMQSSIQDSISIPKFYLQKFGNLTFHNNLIDAHFYIFARWVLDLVPSTKLTDSDNRFKVPEGASIKNYLLPSLLRYQFVPNEAPTSAMDNYLSQGFEMSSSVATSQGRLSCNAFIKKSGFCVRIRTINNFLHANKEIATGKQAYKPYEPMVKGSYIAPSSTVSKQTQVGKECIVGASTKVGDKCSIKRSIIGKHCIIGNRVKIVDSIIMDHVVLEDNCDIRSSIICNSGHIKCDSLVTNCKIGENYTLKNKKSVDEVLVKSSLE